MRTIPNRVISVIGTFFLVTAFSGVFIGVTAKPADAAVTYQPKKCWTWSHSNPYKSIGITLYRTNFSVEWCAAGGKVTEFRVLKCEVSDLHKVFVKRDPADMDESPGGDCKPRNKLGTSSLSVHGRFWTLATTEAKPGGVGWSPGALETNYELQLDSKGRVNGGVQ